MGSDSISLVSPSHTAYKLIVIRADS